MHNGRSGFKSFNFSDERIPRPRNPGARTSERDFYRRSVSSGDSAEAVEVVESHVSKAHEWPIRAVASGRACRCAVKKCGFRCATTVTKAEVVQVSRMERTTPARFLIISMFCVKEMPSAMAG